MPDAQTATAYTERASAVKPLAISTALLLGVAAIVYGIAPLVSGAPQSTVPTPEMSEEERGALRTGVLTLSEKPIHTDTWERTLEPFEGVELKYTIDAGQPMLFSWKADDTLHFDLHSHPFEGGTEMTEGFKKGNAKEQIGVYIAPFSGIHGWFWQNRTMKPVTLRLETTGAFVASTLYEGQGEQDRPIAGVAKSSDTPTFSHQIKDDTD